MGSKKTVQNNEPWQPAQKYIIKGLEQSGQVFDQQQPSLNKYSGMQMDTYGRTSPGAEQGIAGAQSLVNRNLSGANLMGNPYLDKILSSTRENVAGSVNDQFGPAGRFGSGYHTKILTDELAKAENEARFNNYNMERGYQQAAIGDAQDLMGGSQSLLNNAAELPWIGVGALNGNVRQASNGYGKTTSKSSGGLLGSLAGGLAQAGASALMASDERLKTNVVRIGECLDGLGIYEYDYLSPPEGLKEFMPAGRQIGVMASEVAALRPWALGPVVAGFQTVNYGAL